MRQRTFASQRYITQLEQENGWLRARSVAGGGHDDDLGYVFIVSYGRSGSTLLQGILCSIPGYLIRGENLDALHSLFGYHRTLVTGRADNSGKYRSTPQSPWFGIDSFQPEANIRAMRALVVQVLLQPRPDTRVIGFKEIRWWHDDWQEYLSFLTQLFPRAKFVVNRRNRDDVAASEWWSHSDNPGEQLAAHDRRLGEIAEFLGPACFQVRYEDYVADHDALAGLFRWLGEDFARDVVDDVMALRHSY